ncbi:Uma2 family endonuclease [Nodosilinea nodulosa]|uniref:Uma2 family endonuclease n=1 Tax=Nodosilinea nodulosa TaxID=416001 RepID=UPI00030266F4|nr:Uma2 family endonuclease [Nodosilinea nodulosa]
MTADTHPKPGVIFYPESDGQPMTESDPTRDYLIYAIEVLRQFFQSRQQVYVSGNLFIYYREGDPKAVVSPDVFVIFGVSKRQRRSYKAWQEEGKLPSFILEITSRTTRKQDETEKPALYAQLGIREYFQYDPTGDYLSPQLKGRRLQDGVYEPIAPEREGLRSEVLGLDLRLVDPVFPVDTAVPGLTSVAKALRFFDPQTGEKLLNYAEAEQARQQAEQALGEVEQAQLNAATRLLHRGLTATEVAEILELPLEAVLALL